ncbi:MAG TPA: hypothetical protein PK233_03550, partial [Candidatus Atribacteria bacterium]|nr:hypothetical protein [Candidatus Atribacteria bacterium]
APMVPKRKKQKHGFPIEDFGNDERGRSSPLNGFIRGPQYLKNMDASLNFRHDKKRSPRSERGRVRVIFLPFYKANYIVLKARDATHGKIRRARDDGLESFRRELG